MAKPDPNGLGAKLAIRQALDHANLNPSDKSEMVIEQYIPHRESMKLIDQLTYIDQDYTECEMIITENIGRLCN